MCPQIPPLDLKKMATGEGGGHYALRHHVPGGWGPQGKYSGGRGQAGWGGATRGGAGPERGRGASAIQPVQAAAGGIAGRVHLTLGSESVIGTTGL